MIHEDDRVRACQSQAKAAYTGSQEQHIDAGVVIEGLHDVVTAKCLGGAVQAHETDARHQFVEEFILNDIQHLLGLCENQDPMIGSSVDVGGIKRVASNVPDPTIQQQLSMWSASAVICDWPYS